MTTKCIAEHAPLFTRQFTGLTFKRRRGLAGPFRCENAKKAICASILRNHAPPINYCRFWPCHVCFLQIELDSGVRGLFLIQFRRVFGMEEIRFLKGYHRR
jgi:hypothetical protein